MPRNNGVFIPPVSSWNPAIEGQDATPEDYNNQLTDISNALTTSIATDGSSSITNNIPMSGTKLTGLGAGAEPGDSVRFEQLAEKQPLDAGLTALAALTGAGFFRATGTDTYILEDANAHKTALSLNNVENKSSLTIRSEITSGNVTGALGYTPQPAGSYQPAGNYVDRGPGNVIALVWDTGMINVVIDGTFVGNLFPS
jgi:hypothetical protein